MIKARFVIEAMGSPQELVKDTLKNMLEAIKQKFKVEESFIEKPKKSGEKFYTSFIELTVQFKNVQFLFEFMTYYTPTIVEILEPYKLEISAGELENICNDVMSKIHEMDKRLKTNISVNKLLSRQVIQNNTKENV
ncbi:MAG: hypothetical protein JW791_00530 [Nanoarchaeota archaeon]|nr:hypothetical protein [Nanoarchaeota archaeon]